MFLSGLRELILQPEGFDLRLSDSKLLDLATDGHGQRIHNPNMLWDLKVCNLSPAVVHDFPGCQSLPRFGTDPRRNYLTHLQVRQANHTCFANFGMSD